MGHKVQLAISARPPGVWGFIIIRIVKAAISLVLSITNSQAQMQEQVYCIIMEHGQLATNPAVNPFASVYKDIRNRITLRIQNYRRIFKYQKVCGMY
jgi:hypothetical protein